MSSRFAACSVVLLSSVEVSRKTPAGTYRRARASQGLAICAVFQVSIEPIPIAAL